MKFALFISALSVLVVAKSDLSRIADILTAESTDLNNCDLIKTNSQHSLGHKIAQVVCDEQLSEMHRRFISFVKYVLFGIICSISTYLVFGTNDSKTVDYARTEIVEREGEAVSPTTSQGPVVEKQELESVQPELKEISYEVVKLEQVNVLPEAPELPMEDNVSLEEKSLDSDTKPTCPVENDKEEKEEKQFEGDCYKVDECDLSEYLPPYPPVLNLGNDELLDFEAYKNNIERQHTQFFRPRSFSDPKGSERYIQYPYTIADAIQNQHIGEPPESFTMPLNVLPRHLAHENLDNFHEPGSPNRNQLDMIEDMMQVQVVEPGSVEQVPPEQKINERKPMVFVGGVSASTTPLELVTELKKQGFNVTVVPRIRYGVSFGFCPDLVLSSEAEVENLLSMGRVWVKDRWVDIRPYIPKEEPHAQTSRKTSDAASMESRTPPQTQTQTQMFHEVVGNNVEYISHEELMSSCPTSPLPSQNTTPSIGNSSPMTPGTHQAFVPHMNPPFIQMTPVIPFSPGNYPPHMMHPFFHPQEQHLHVYSPPHMHSPSPPEKHPMQMFDDRMVAYTSLESIDTNAQPINGGANIFKLVSN